MNQQSYCLDVSLGYDEWYRNELLAFLKGIVSEFGITTVQRYRMDETKALRVLTPQAVQLQRHIIHAVRTGDDNIYAIYGNEVEAHRSMALIPDYNHPLGDKPFTLTDWEPPADHASRPDAQRQMVTWDDDSIY